MKKPRRVVVPVPPSSEFAGFRFPPEVIVVAVRWYLRFGLSYRDVEELLAERGIEVDHVTISRWVQRFTPLLADAASPTRHAVGDRWFIDVTYVKVAGKWRYVHRAIDQFGQVIDIYVSARRDGEAARRFFQHALVLTKTVPCVVTTDRTAVYPRILDELAPQAWHRTEQYGNNRIEADHGQLKRRLRPMRGLKTDRGATVVIRGHALVRNIRRGHYNSPSTSRRTVESLPRSTNSRPRSDPEPVAQNPNISIAPIEQRNKAIEADPANPALIVTIWGMGYRFDGRRG